MKNLVIREELQNLLPHLSESEYAGLEADIIANGCLSAIVTWNDVIVDGHHRYRICQTHGIPFETKPLEFQSLDEAMFWAWAHQENRRNLSSYQRAQIALRFKPILISQAKEKESNRKSTLQKSVKSDKTCNTRQDLAEIAGVSRDTIARVEFLEMHADDATKEKLCRGETTINREYNRAKEKVADPKPKKPRAKKSKAETPVTESPEEPKPSEASPSRKVPCIEELNYVPRTTLQNIRQDKPEHLLINLNMHFRKGYIHELIVDGMAYLHAKQGIAATAPIALELAKLYIEGFDKFLKKQPRH